MRSDCWPCAKKREFIRVNNSPETKSSKEFPPVCSVTSGAAAAAPNSVPTNSPSKKAATSPAKRKTQAKSASAAPVPPADSPATRSRANKTVWAEATLPSASSTDSSPPSHFVVAERSAAGSTRHWDPALFCESFLRAQFDAVRQIGRKQVGEVVIHDDAPSRTVFVALGESLRNYVSSLSDDTTTIESLASVAQAVGPAVADVIHTSAHQREQSNSLSTIRVFCSHETTFAALCAYNYIVSKSCSSAASPITFKVFGPAPDKTKRPTLCTEVIRCCGGVEAVPSMQERHAAVRSLYERTHLLVSADGATGCAIWGAVPHAAREDSTALSVVLMGGAWNGPTSPRL